MEGADFLCLHFEGADPNGANKSVEECVALAKAVSDAVTMPIVVMGCKNIEKDTELFNKVAEALAGKNILVLSARDENYKTVGASAGLAYNQKVGAESAVDINLAKQLNTVMTQLGVNAQNIVMNIGSAAAGYGYEYVASTLDRIKDAALKQAGRHAPDAHHDPPCPPIPGASRNPSCPRLICQSGAARKSAASKWKSPPRLRFWQVAPTQ